MEWRINPDVSVEHTRAQERAFQLVITGQATPAIYRDVPELAELAAEMGVPLYVPAPPPPLPPSPLEVARSNAKVAAHRRTYARRALNEARDDMEAAWRYDRTADIAKQRRLSESVGIPHDEARAAEHARRHAAWLRANAIIHVRDCRVRLRETEARAREAAHQLAVVKRDTQEGTP